jgi:6-phosphogluconolactonase (cycloisomerase 2 family)
MSKETTIAPKNGGQRNGGHLYMQTNEIENCIIHYHWSANGALTEVERVATGGAGSGTFKPISRQESVPNAFEGAGSVNLTEDKRFLFATNGGDNSVSSFAVGADSGLALLETKATGNAVEGKSGTAKSLTFCPSTNTLFRIHGCSVSHK